MSYYGTITLSPSVPLYVDATSLPKCKYFDETLFLHEKECNIPTQSNFESEENTRENEIKDQIATPIAVNTIKRKNSNDMDKRIIQELSNFDRELKKVMIIKVKKLPKFSLKKLYCLKKKE